MVIQKRYYPIYLHNYLLTIFLFQFSQNIVRFEFKEDKVSLDHIKQLIKFWVDAYSADVNEELINNFNRLPIPPKANYDLSYFTQLIWAKTDRIGES